MDNSNKKKSDNELVDLDKTFKQGVGGGVLGAFAGVPGVGMGLGVLNANKDKFKNFTTNNYNKTKKKGNNFFNF